MTTTAHRYTHVQTLKTRDEATQSCYDHTASINRKRNEYVERVHSDNAKKFFSMNKVLGKIRIKLFTTSIHMAESNGAAERIDRTPLEKEDVMKKKAGMPQKFLGKADNEAACQ